MKLKIALLALIASLTMFNGFAQEGKYLHTITGMQLCRLLNSDDIKEEYFGNFQLRVSTLDTYRPGFGFEYVDNFDTSYGWQIGLLYSGNGQRYSGSVKDTTPGVDNYIAFQSKVLLDYIKIPISFRFNSPYDASGRIAMNIYTGLFISVLARVSAVEVEPSLSRLPTTNTDFYKLFSPIDYGWHTGAQFSIRIVKNTSITLGGRFDRSFADAENKSFFTNMTTSEYQNYKDNNPDEYLYPIGVKKLVTPSKTDYITRLKTKNSAIAFYVGLSIKL